MANIILNKTSAKTLEQVPLVNDTIRSRIAVMTSANIQDQVADQLESEPSEVQLAAG